MHKTAYGMQLICADQCCQGWNATSNSPLTCERKCSGTVSGYSVANHINVLMCVDTCILEHSPSI